MTAVILAIQFLLLLLVLLCACTPQVAANPNTTPETLTTKPPPLVIILPTTKVTPQPAPVRAVFDGPLSVSIFELEDHQEVFESPLTLSGEADPGTVITINDEVLLVDDSRIFSLQISLEPGPNLIEITASDLQNNQEFAYLSIYYEEIQ